MSREEKKNCLGAHSTECAILPFDSISKFRRWLHFMVWCVFCVFRFWLSTTLSLSRRNDFIWACVCVLVCAFLFTVSLTKNCMQCVQSQRHRYRWHWWHMITTQIWNKKIVFLFSFWQMRIHYLQRLFECLLVFHSFYFVVSVVIHISEKVYCDYRLPNCHTNSILALKFGNE